MKYQYITCLGFELPKKDKRYPYGVTVEIPSLILCNSREEAEQQGGYYYKFVHVSGDPGSKYFCSVIAAFKHSETHMDTDKQGRKSLSVKVSDYAFSLDEEEFRMIGGKIFALRKREYQLYFPDLPDEMKDMPVLEQGEEIRIPFSDMCDKTTIGKTFYMDDEAYGIEQYEDDDPYVSKINVLMEKKLNEKG